MAPARRPGRRLQIVLALVLAVALGTGGGLYLASRGSSGPSAATVALMGLSQLPPTPAPDFSLTDQNGQTRTMASFRGRVVVLYFMDDKCTDICPVVGQEFINAQKLLGAQASKVAFVGINVNPNHTSVDDVRAFDAANGLDHLSTWSYVTGTPAQLQQVWNAYGITVQVDPTTKAVIHTSTMTFIDPGGVEQQVAFPAATAPPGDFTTLPDGQLGGWSQGIADVVTKLL